MFNDPGHCLMSKYKCELQLCGKPSCYLCPPCHIRTMMTPDRQLQRRLLNCMDLPVGELDNKERFLSQEDARKRLDEGLSRS